MRHRTLASKAFVTPPTSPVRIAIIGCGSIGTQIAVAVRDRFEAVATLDSVCETNPKNKLAFDRTVGVEIPSLDLDSCFERADLVIESAHQSVVPDVLRKSAQFDCEVMILSVGGILLEPALLDGIKAKGVRIFIPSGAIGGIDLIKAAGVGKIYSVEITTKKPLDALKGAPFFSHVDLDLNSILGEQVIYEGKAGEAVKMFPQNVNVAATLSLAGIGAQRTRVKIATSRTLKKNIHEIAVEGEFGRACFSIENEPSRANAKTSRLAAYSAIATLEKILYGVEIGT